MTIHGPDLARVLSVSVVLRAPVVVVSPLVPVILLESTISAGIIGFAAGATLLWFALGALLVPSVFTRWTPHAMVHLGLVVTGGGIVLRSLGPSWAFLAGAALLGVGIGALNIAVPNFIAGLVSLPRVVGSLVAIGLNIGAILAAALAVYVDRLVDDWRLALGFPLVFVLLAVAGAGRRPAQSQRPSGRAGVSVRSLRGRRTLTLLTVLMFVQSSAYYVFLTWFPYAIVREGVSLELAGVVVSLNQVGQLVAALTLTYALRRSRRLEWLEAVFLAGVAVGGALILLDSATALVVGSLILGIGNGSGLAVVLSLITVKSPTVAVAQAASGLVQGVAYGGTALVPVLFGLASQEPVLRMLLCLFLVAAGVAMVVLWGLLRRSEPVGAAEVGERPGAAAALG
ncbi:CynX/NimT family MFS transporter [Ornithinimicrobium cavernae]|uniref:MFS transporter n=1 Tax=Ornithinimicrobium cavernae TaxID=2666047 RepID=UPI000D6917AB|nr:MFS transporter [Ornithinimicrobium cavernae]